MSDTATAKLFEYNGKQTVQLPNEFRLPGKEVRIRRVGRGLLLEPARDRETIKAIFEEIDRLSGSDFLPEGRPEQPPMPPPRNIFDE